MSNKYSYAELFAGVGESTDPISLIQFADVLIRGLTSGEVRLEHLQEVTAENPNPQWETIEDGIWTSDVFETLYLSTSSTKVRLAGHGNNDGVYLKIERSETRTVRVFSDSLDRALDGVTSLVDAAGDSLVDNTENRLISNGE